jgi:formate-nitrite transporter family protein
VGAPEPDEIYERTKREGERRLSRPFVELVATAAAAGIDVVFGVMALGVVTALFAADSNTHVAHFAGSLAFGVAFVFIVVGRSELFTENFLVPLAGLDRRERASWLKLVELWTVSPVTNVLAGALFVVILTTHGVMPHGTGHAIVDTANKLDENQFLAALMSAIAAGALITLMTWMVEGQEGVGVRIAVAWIVGSVLALANLNHVIVATLEMLMGIRYGAPIGWDDLFANFGTALLGNLIGGIGFVTITRFSQARSGRSGA